MTVSVPYVFVNGTVADGTQVNADFAAVVAGVNASVVSGGALGTPTSGSLANCTGLPISTGVSGLGTTVATALGNAVNTASGVVQLNGSGYQPAIPEVGVTDGSSAAAGNIGEVLSVDVNNAAAVGVSNGVDKTIMSLTLTAGDWDVHGSIVTKPASGTTTAVVAAGFSLTTNDLSGVGVEYRYQVNHAFVANDLFASPVPSQFIRVSGSTPVYMVAIVNFAVSTMAVYGQMYARRMR